MISKVNCLIQMCLNSFLYYAPKGGLSNNILIDKSPIKLPQAFKKNFKERQLILKKKIQS